MVEAQLVEHSLLAPAISGSNPVISKFYLQSTYSICIEEKKEKELGMANEKKH